MCNTVWAREAGYRGQVVASCSDLCFFTAAASTEVEAGSGHANVHWKWERYATVGLLGSVGMGLVYPSPLVDYSLAVLLPLHAHWCVCVYVCVCVCVLCVCVHVM